VANWIKPLVHDLALRLPNEESLTNIWVPILILVGVLIAIHRNSLLFLDDITPKARLIFMVVMFGICLLISLVLLLGPLGGLPNYETLLSVTKLRIPAF
jgi:hypothetical protein